MYYFLRPAPRSAARREAPAGEASGEPPPGGAAGRGRQRAGTGGERGGGRGAALSRHRHRPGPGSGGRAQRRGLDRAGRIGRQPRARARQRNSPGGCWGGGGAGPSGAAGASRRPRSQARRGGQGRRSLPGASGLALPPVCKMRSSGILKWSSRRDFSKTKDFSYTPPSSQACNAGNVKKASYETVPELQGQLIFYITGNVFPKVRI